MIIKIHFRGHNYPIWCMDVSKNGLFIVTGSHDKTAKLWSLDRTFPVRVFVGHMSDVTVSFFVYQMNIVYHMKFLLRFMTIIYFNG